MLLYATVADWGLAGHQELCRAGWHHSSVWTLSALTMNYTLFPPRRGRGSLLPKNDWRKGLNIYPCRLHTRTVRPFSCCPHLVALWTWRTRRKGRRQFSFRSHCRSEKDSEVPALLKTGFSAIISLSISSAVRWTQDNHRGCSALSLAPRHGPGVRVSWPGGPHGCWVGITDLTLWTISWIALERSILSVWCSGTILLYSGLF